MYAPPGTGVFHYAQIVVSGLVAIERLVSIDATKRIVAGADGRCTSDGVHRIVHLAVAVDPTLDELQLLQGGRVLARVLPSS